LNKPVIEQMQERDAQEAIAWEENEEETEGRGL